MDSCKNRERVIKEWVTKDKLRFYKKLFFPIIAICFVVSLFSDLAFAAPPLLIRQNQNDKTAQISPEASLFIQVANKESGNDLGTGAMDFVQSMANRAIGFLSDNNLTIEQKKKSFRTLLQDSFDLKTLGRFSLGRYWRVSTPEQRKEYQTLFEKMVIEVYSQRFTEYKGQKFVARSYRNDSPTDTLVTSFIIPDNGPEVQVDWRIRYKDGHYKVVDIIVEGVSMSVTQRSDFSSVIQRGGGDVQVLLTHLQAL